MNVCPYFQVPYNTCNLYGTHQDGYQKDNYCLSGDNWKRCANYDKSSNEYKLTKRVN